MSSFISLRVVFQFACWSAFLTIVNSAQLDARTSCYSGVFTIIARGSEEPQGGSVLEPIAGNVSALIPNSGSNEVVYPALLSFWNSAPTGVTNAQQQMQDYHNQCPDGKIVLMGYSQGSYVLATALAGGNFSGQTWAPLATNIAQNVAAIVLFGNPSRVLGQGTTAEGTNCANPCSDTSPLALTGSYSTAMDAYSNRTESWCDAEDPICCSSGNNITAHLSYWSTNTTDEVAQFVQGQVNAAENGTSTTSTTSSLSSATTSAASSTASAPFVSSASAALSSALEKATTSTALEAAATEKGASTSAQAPTSTVPSSSPSASPASSASRETAGWIATAACSIWLSWMLV